MLKESGALLPHGWITGDDEMGRSSRFRADLRGLKERYLLAAPSNTLIRDLDGATPAWRGQGPHPKRAFEQARRWSQALPPAAWRRIEVGDGARGPQFVELVATRVLARTDRGRIGPEELTGRPDRIIKVDGTIIIEEWKSSRTLRPWHRAQMGTYFLLVEEQLRIRPSHGFIVCGDGSRHRIENSDDLRVWVLEMAGQIRAARAVVAQPIAVDPVPGQCRPCGMRGHCGQARL